jgi:hypothetical protein
MKIQVGKTYNDTAGNSWLVECRLTNPNRQKQPYVCTGLNGYHNTCYLDENGRSSGGGIKLVPVKVKKEGWITMWRDDRYGYGSYPGVIVHTSEAEARKSAMGSSFCISVIHISWEEEE